MKELCTKKNRPITRHVGSTARTFHKQTPVSIWRITVTNNIAGAQQGPSFCLAAHTQRCMQHPLQLRDPPPVLRPTNAARRAVGIITTSTFFLCASGGRSLFRVVYRVPHEDPLAPRRRRGGDGPSDSPNTAFSEIASEAIMPRVKKETSLPLLLRHQVGLECNTQGNPERGQRQSNRSLREL